MEHQKILHLLNKASDSKFLTRKWDIATDNSNLTYGVGNDVIYNTEILISNLGNYKVADILLRGVISIIGHLATQ